jgi:hypothetical protein
MSWLSSLDDAQAKAKAESKLVLLETYPLTEWTAKQSFD